MNCVIFVSPLQASEFFFEVWNEPNDQFWRGGEGQPGQSGLTKQTSYFELYRQAALALKAASPKLQVGGPATCCADCWIGDFVTYMDNRSIPYDFISTHACEPPLCLARTRTRPVAKRQKEAAHLGATQGGVREGVHPPPADLPPPPMLPNCDLCASHTHDAPTLELETRHAKWAGLAT